MKNARTFGLALALLAAVISGVSVYVNATAVRAVGDPAVYTTAKNGVAALLLLAVLVGRRGGSARAGLAGLAGEGRRPGRSADSSGARASGGEMTRARRWAGVAAIAVVGGSVPFVLFFTGLAETGAPQAAFLQKTLVVWVAVLAVVALRERLTTVHWVAIALLVAGQWWLAGGAWFALDRGALLILAATLLWSVETVLARRLLAEIPGGTLAVARMGLGGVLLVGWLAATGRLGALASLSAGQWGWVALTGVLLACYVATWYAALARAQAVDVTAVLVLGAVVTALLDAGVRGVVPAGAPALGLLAVGVVLVAWTMRRRPEPAVS